MMDFSRSALEAQPHPRRRALEAHQHHHRRPDRLASEEAAAAIREIRANAEKELDGYVRRATEFMRTAEEQRPMYEGPQQMLERAHRGEARRSEYTIQLRDAGPIGLARVAQLAVGGGTPR